MLEEVIGCQETYNQMFNLYTEATISLIEMQSLRHERSRIVPEGAD